MSIFLYAGGNRNSVTAISALVCNAVCDWLLFPSPAIHDEGARGRYRGGANIKLEETLAELSSIHLITSMPCPDRHHPPPVTHTASGVPPTEQQGNNFDAVREHEKRRDPHPKTNCRLLRKAFEGGRGGGLTSRVVGCKSRIHEHLELSAGLEPHGTLWRKLAG